MAHDLVCETGPRICGCVGCTAFNMHARAYRPVNGAGNRAWRKWYLGQLGIAELA